MLKASLYRTTEKKATTLNTNCLLMEYGLNHLSLFLSVQFVIIDNING